MPIWASLCGLCLIGERIGKFTVVAMLVSFCGVMVISCSPYILKTVDLNSVDTEIDTNSYGISSVGTANLVGCSLILVNSIC